MSFMGTELYISSEKESLLQVTKSANFSHLGLQPASTDW
jgi:hypothetical protein